MAFFRVFDSGRRRAWQVVPIADDLIALAGARFQADAIKDDDIAARVTNEFPVLTPTEN